MDCIYVWADGTWCVNGELHEMGHMSDDYEIVPVGDDESYELVAERHFSSMHV